MKRILFLFLPFLFLTVFLVSCTFSQGKLEIQGKEGDMQGQRVVLINKSSDEVITFTVKKEETTYDLINRDDMSGEKVGETTESTQTYTLNPGEYRKVGSTWSKPVFRKVLIKRDFSIAGEVVKE